MKYSVDPVREATFQALRKVYEENCPIDEGLFDNSVDHHRARALRLTRETIRYAPRFEQIIARVTSSPPDLPIQIILEMGIYEILIEGSARYGVVNSLVDLTKSMIETRSAQGFVNAVLRKIDPVKMEAKSGSSLAPYVESRLNKMFDASTVRAINAQHFMKPPLDLRLRKSLDLEEWAKKLNGVAEKRFHTIRIERHEQLSKTEGYDEGAWWVQDCAATMAVDCFSDLAEKKALDLCAAPGGKTMQMLDYGAQVTAVELAPERSIRLKRNLERVNMWADIHIGDALKFKPATLFDAILLDAPCSATGTIRRHPELRLADIGERVKTLIPIQTRLLRHAFSMLKTGGELIFVTCSLLSEEGEMQIDHFLKNEKSAKALPIDASQFGIAKRHENYLRSLPCDHKNRGGMDGFFVAKITKI